MESPISPDTTTTPESVMEKNLPKSPQPPLPFLEVVCQSTGKTWRFAAGTEAGFALLLINRKRDIGSPPTLYIEAAKDGEEHVSFGPKAVLVNYGEGWKLKTVTEEAYEEVRQSDAKQPGDPHLDGKSSVSKFDSSFLYIGKILLAFLFIFLLGGLFTLFLENLPILIMSMNPSL